MRLLRLLTVTALALLLWPALPARAVEIPAYTPNVVDPAGVLTAEERQRVNAALQQVRETQQIWGAVYIVPSLDGDSIEDLAQRAFRQWRLGRKDADNGLLLVLSMQDRRSRFEVGYGLEGSLPDVVARHALDDYLTPRMRQGDTAGAIIDAFGFMARVAANDPASLQELSPPSSLFKVNDPPDWVRGRIAWGSLMALIWLLMPLRRYWMRYRCERLLRQHPALADKREESAESMRTPWSKGLFIRLFLSINPGVFVAFLGALLAPGLAIAIGIELLVLILTLALSGRHFRSPERFRSFLQQQARQREALVRKGPVVKRGSSGYADTAPYYERSSSSSSESSSSSSSSDSSSGGGSSGGGGASSSW